jgi:hypothetical protein
MKTYTFEMHAHRTNYRTWWFGFSYDKTLKYISIVQHACTRHFSEKNNCAFNMYQLPFSCYMKIQHVKSLTNAYKICVRSEIWKLLSSCSEFQLNEYVNSSFHCIDLLFALDVHISYFFALLSLFCYQYIYYVRRLSSGCRLVKQLSEIYACGKISEL